MAKIVDEGEAGQERCGYEAARGPAMVPDPWAEFRHPVGSIVRAKLVRDSAFVVLGHSLDRGGDGAAMRYCILRSGDGSVIRLAEAELEPVHAASVQGTRQLPQPGIAERLSSALETFARHLERERQSATLLPPIPPKPATLPSRNGSHQPHRIRKAKKPKPVGPSLAA